MNFKKISILLSLGAICSSAVYGMDETPELKYARLQAEARQQARHQQETAEEDQSAQPLSAVQRLGATIRGLAKNRPPFDPEKWQHIDSELKNIVLAMEQEMEEDAAVDAQITVIRNNPALNDQQKTDEINTERAKKRNRVFL